MATNLVNITNNLESCKKMIQYCELLERTGDRFELMTNLNVLFRSLGDGNFIEAKQQQLE